MASKRVRFAEEQNEEYSALDDNNDRNRKRSRIGFDDEDDDDEPVAETSTKGEKKHTLDSDEEDETDAYDRLDMEKVEGQEDATLEYEGRVKIMPFNMKEDLEEGHFDADGTFIFDKKSDKIKDAWLDNIEWDNIKNAAGKNWGKLNDDKDDAEDTPEKDVDLRALYSRLLEVLKEKETIAGALKRLNTEKGLSAVEERKRRWAAKKAGTNVQAEDENSKLVTELTSLADSLVSLGHMEAYQLSPPMIKHLLGKMEPPPQPVVAGPGAKEATMDMFSD